MIRMGAGQLDLNEVIYHPHRITTDLDARIVRPGPVRQAEAPGMPGTGDDAFLQVTAAEGSPHVRADIVDGKVLALKPKDCDQLVANHHRLAFAFDYIIDPADGVKIAHGPLANPSGPGSRTLS